MSFIAPSYVPSVAPSYVPSVVRSHSSFVPEGPYMDPYLDDPYMHGGYPISGTMAPYYPSSVGYGHPSSYYGAYEPHGYHGRHRSRRHHRHHHHYPRTIGSRIMNFFGLPNYHSPYYHDPYYGHGGYGGYGGGCFSGLQRVRYYNPRSGIETDRRGRPVYTM